MNQKKEHNRRSLRLKNYDYSSLGFYFITICVRNREPLFGEIEKGNMKLNECGNIAERFWKLLDNRYTNVYKDAFVVMPNHIHGIIEIRNQSVGAIHELPLPIEEPFIIKKQRRKMLLPKMVGWYKMNVAKHVNIQLKRTGNPFWQRNYYEHIIRNKESLFRIREYIKQNPAYWDEDRFHYPSCGDPV